MMKDIHLQEFCKELHIYEIGIASWPLPENAKTILYETNPCPFTAADVEERLLGTTEFTPKSAIVCLFPYYVEPFGNIISRLTAADQELIAYLAVAGVLLLYEIIIFFCVLGGSRKQGRDGNTIDNGRGLTSFIIIAAGSYLSAVFASLIPQIPAALQGIQSALTVYGSLKNTLLPICAAGVVSCIIRKFIIK